MFLTFPTFSVEIDDTTDCTLPLEAAPKGSNNKVDFCQYDLGRYQDDVQTTACRRAHKAWVMTRRQRRLQSSKEADPSALILPGERRSYDETGKVVLTDAPSNNPPDPPGSDPVEPEASDTSPIEDISSCRGTSLFDDI